MTDTSAKEKLVSFLDKHAFDPVLRADPENFPDSVRDELKDVQQSTQTERERFHSYGSADQVYEMFHDDLSSEPAQKVHRQLDRLGLPTLNDCRDDFDRLANELGVR